jgi:hypothetical protein
MRHERTPRRANRPKSACRQTDNDLKTENPLKRDRRHKSNASKTMYLLFFQPTRCPTAGVSGRADGQDSTANQRHCQQTCPVPPGRSPVRCTHCWAALMLAYFASKYTKHYSNNQECQPYFGRHGINLSGIKSKKPSPVRFRVKTT